MAEAYPTTLRFLLIGQSNMAGRGVLDDLASPVDGRILMFRESAWVTARDPLHTDPRGWAGAGLGMGFARTLRASRPECVIRLIPCAVGGSPLADWMPGARLYAEALAVTRGALGGEDLHGVLWHQGETDAEVEADAESYLPRARRMFETLVKDIGAPRTAILIGELGRYLAGSKDIRWSATVNAALRALASELPRAAFVSSEGLGDKGDCLHFDTASLRLFGERYARAFLSIPPSLPGA